MIVAGWLLIAGMIGLFISSDIILFKIIKDKKVYSLKKCYAMAIMEYSLIVWVLLLSLMCILIMAFNSGTVDGMEISYSIWEYIYGFLLVGIPILQSIIVLIGTIKYTVSILEKKWWHPLIALGIAAAGFSLVYTFLSTFL